MKSFNNDYERYNTEAKERWGDTAAYKEHEERTKDYSKGKWNSLAEDMDKIMAEFSLCMSEGKSPASGEAQELVKKLQSHITNNYYNCTNEILSGLGQMYVSDERFKKNIDKYGEGTARFICEAINCCC